jgi:hypothetical protein
LREVDANNNSTDPHLHLPSGLNENTIPLGVAVDPVLILQQQQLESRSTLEELKEKCRELKLKISGKKSEIAQRIIEYLHTHGAKDGSFQEERSSHSLKREATPLADRKVKKQKSFTSSLSSSSQSVNSLSSSQEKDPSMSHQKHLLSSNTFTAPPKNSPDWDPNIYQIVETKDPTGVGFVSRLHHSSLVYQDKMIVFGGAVEPAVGRKPPSSLINSINVFDFHTGNWSLMHCSGLPPPPRRDHTGISSLRTKHKKFNISD